MAVLLKLIDGLIAIPKIGELIERLFRAVSVYLAEKRFQEATRNIEDASDQTRRALTKEESIEALKRWARL